MYLGVLTCQMGQRHHPFGTDGEFLVTSQADMAVTAQGNGKQVSGFNRCLVIAHAGPFFGHLHLPRLDEGDVGCGATDVHYQGIVHMREETSTDGASRGRCIIRRFSQNHPRLAPTAHVFPQSLERVSFK